MQYAGYGAYRISGFEVIRKIDAVSKLILPVLLYAVCWICNLSEKLMRYRNYYYYGVF